jgi:hypothetical protein
MNQHITKLVRQALKECVSTPVESVIASRIDDHGIVEIPNTFAEKFAELLIRECVTKMALEIMDEQWVDDAVKNTYTHFGVEE